MSGFYLQKIWLNLLLSLFFKENNTSKCFVDIFKFCILNIFLRVQTFHFLKLRNKISMKYLLLPKFWADFKTKFNFSMLLLCTGMINVIDPYYNYMIVIVIALIHHNIDQWFPTGLVPTPWGCW